MKTNIKQLEEQVLAISKDLHLSHISSNISCLPLLVEIYGKKKAGDIVILDNAHAHLAHLVVMEQRHLLPLQTVEGEAKRLIGSYGIHCHKKAGCDASGGSLGHGLGIGIGYALADPKRQVYVILSEGSMMEGSTWESLRIADELQLQNIHLYTNFNGFSAVAEIDSVFLAQRMQAYAQSLDIHAHLTTNPEGFAGVAGHYTPIT